METPRSSCGSSLPPLTSCRAGALAGGNCTLRPAGVLGAAVAASLCGLPKPDAIGFINPSSVSVLLKSTACAHVSFPFHSLPDAFQTSQKLQLLDVKGVSSSLSGVSSTSSSCWVERVRTRICLGQKLLRRKGQKGHAR